MNEFCSIIVIGKEVDKKFKFMVNRNEIKGKMISSIKEFYGIYFEYVCLITKEVSANFYIEIEKELFNLLAVTSRKLNLQLVSFVNLILGYKELI